MKFSPNSYQTSSDEDRIRETREAFNKREALRMAIFEEQEGESYIPKSMRAPVGTLADFQPQKAADPKRATSFSTMPRPTRTIINPATGAKFEVSDLPDVDDATLNRLRAEMDDGLRGTEPVNTDDLIAQIAMGGIVGRNPVR